MGLQNGARASFSRAFSLLNLATRCYGQYLRNPTALNPLAGQGVPPDGIPYKEYPVNVQLEFQRLLSIDASQWTFTLAFYITRGWRDAAAADIIMSNYTSCNFYCTSIQSTILNSAGLPACCDGVFIPQAESSTVAGWDSQSIPFYHYLQPSLGDPERIFYTAYAQGTFSAAFNFQAYPFDKHYLCLDVETAFQPILGDRAGLNHLDIKGAAVGAIKGNLVSSQRPLDRDQFQPGASRPPVRSPNLAQWQVGQVWMDVVDYAYFAATDAYTLTDGYRGAGSTPHNYTSPGVRFCVEAYRQNRSFFIIIIVLPISLITFFSFGIFSYSRSQLKGRIDLLSTLFLTVILLQFVLNDNLPDAYTLTVPLWLILVSYIYSFILVVICIVSNNILSRPERVAKAKHRSLAHNEFKLWRQYLSTGRLLAGSPGNDALTPPHVGSDQTKILDSASIDDGVQTYLETRADNQSSENGRSGAPQLHTSQKKTGWLMRGIRRLKQFITFSGSPESQQYLDSMVQRAESWTRGILFCVYIATVVAVCGTAHSQAESAARFHTLPKA